MLTARATWSHVVMMTLGLVVTRHTSVGANEGAHPSARHPRIDHVSPIMRMNALQATVAIASSFEPIGAPRKLWLE
jgi:hypothetical protein